MIDPVSVKKKLYLPKKGFRGVDNIAEIIACIKSIAECGTENGWANA